MLTYAVLSSLFMGLASAQTAAKTFTSWDCCKPVCANTVNFRPDILTNRGVASVCNAQNQFLPLQQGILAQSSCAGGAGFLCDSYQPIPISEDQSIGFALQVGVAKWGGGGKEDDGANHQHRRHSHGESDVKLNDLIILTPGGGVGPYNTGCQLQYGAQYANAWGADYGGVTSRENCANLPDNLQAGCYWRYNWARGELNGWDIVYNPVTCPDRLVEVSGCAA
ncbi:unnamed protein product [Parascedosporium putredinis]|uniref:cellulase n=1 Tax=Parascedosporium putredinis TaxID=1442378 RepID=A0A9P1H4D6_9PEZI|nr:unnamed protein product [Parascedosporium putredinis]CAI7996472.1 unnamed protein product [Parascedosporium putredinis]